MMLRTWLPSWNDLPPDAYLKDGGHYRRSRHSCFVVNGESVQQTPHRAHWQPLEYNALHGGMQRMFEPMSANVVAIIRLGNVAEQIRGRVYST